MSCEHEKSTSRRKFLKASVALPVAVAGLPAAAAAAENDNEKETAAGPLPMRKLGKNGPEITILNIGGMMGAHNPQYLDLAWKMGIRYFDTADCYKRGQSERDVGAWIGKYPERRKDLFVVTKDHPRNGPEELLEMIDRRLENIGNTDYVDLFFIHGIGTREYGDESLEWPKSDRLKKVFAELKESGKVKMCGFSCHDDHLVDYLNAAAEGGFVDAIMLKYNAFMKPGDDLDKALDACHKAGIGLVAMKEMRPIRDAPKTHPKLESTGLTTHQTMLQMVWSDPRISSICSAIDNIQIMEENTTAARTFKDPVPDEVRSTVEEIASLISVPMCPGCPSCSEMARKTEYAFSDISRYVTYYEQDGLHEARDYFKRLDVAQRTPKNVDLAQLRDACQFKVNYPEIARRSEMYFA